MPVPGAGGGGCGVLPMMVCTGSLCPKGVSFTGFRYERLGISLGGR